MEAKGAERATTEGRAKKTSRVTSLTGTRLVRISWARRRSWFTKKIMKKNRKETRKEKRASVTM
jgi:hypothetical protein